MSNEQMIDPSEELDLSGDTFERVRADFAITKAVLKESKNTPGAQVVHLTLKGEFPGYGGEEMTSELRDFLTIKHPKRKVQARGRSQLRALYVAAFGDTRGSIPSLVGNIVNAEVYEDKEGNLRVGRYQAAESASADESDETPVAATTLQG